MALKGLIIREPWMGEILAGRKTWELRSKPFRHRGEIALIRKGSGFVVGIANMVDCLPPLNERRLRETVHLHRVPPDEINEVIAKGWTYPWVLSDVQSLPSPVPYSHKPGAVITHDLDEEVERKVRRQLNLVQRRLQNLPAGGAYERPVPKPLALGTMSGTARAEAMAALPHIGGKSLRSITAADLPNEQKSAAQFETESPCPPRNVSSAVNFKRSKLRRSLETARLTLGAIAALVTGICLLTWIGCLFFVGIVAAIFTWAGIRWFVWAMLGAMLMGATGVASETSRGRRNA